MPLHEEAFRRAQHVAQAAFKSVADGVPRDKGSDVYADALKAAYDAADRALIAAYNGDQDVEDKVTRVIGGGSMANGYRDLARAVLQAIGAGVAP